MPRGIDYVDGVVVTVGVEVLRPGVEGGAGVGILREEARRGRVVVAGVHVQQARGVRNAPRAAGGCVAARGRCFLVRHAVVKVLNDGAAVSPASFRSL